MTHWTMRRIHNVMKTSRSKVSSRAKRSEVEGSHKKGQARLSLTFCYTKNYAFFFSSFTLETMRQMRQTMNPSTQMGPAVLIACFTKAPDRSFGAL